ncbi:glycerophosphodiester phosphodiesterase [Roseovarius sp. D22-M7]|uniref:glycerophosphodiester phosphodiesterase n=1 Tax=Roseovarius sp. D22-M7 TaxID=3127116 RepID=UPI0030101C50
MGLYAVLSAYRHAVSDAVLFTALHLGVRLAVSIVMLPLAGLTLGLVLRWSGDPALTDQEIAGFLLSPVGAGAAMAAAGLLLVAAVLDLALMTAALRQPVPGLWPGLAGAWRRVLPRLGAVFGLGLRLLLRVAVLSAPFLAAAIGVAALTLRAHDVNYYLAARPPEFLLAAAVIAVLGSVLAALLVWRLSGWALALHLRLIDRVPAGACLARSETRLQGRRGRVAKCILGWLALRLALAAGIAALMGALGAALQALVLPDLTRVVLVLLATLALWSLANAVLAGVSNGALARLLTDLHRETAPRVPAFEDPAPAGGPVLVGLALVAGLAGVGAVAVLGDLADRLAAPPRVEIIAHRGAAALRPENTLAAVEKALEDRADRVEIDVQEIADGTVIVTHDSDFMKQAGLPLKVWQATRDDLARIDVGRWFDPAHAGTRVPTLRAVLETAKGRGQVLIELKYYGHDDRLEERVIRIVEQAGMTRDVAIMSLKRAGVAKVRRLRPDWPVGILAARAIGNLGALDADFLAVNTGQISRQLVRRAHATDKRVFVWTVDDPRAMARMISMGVDGIITNDPALARQIMEEYATLSLTERLLVWLSDRLRLDRPDAVAAPSDA